MLNHKQLEQYHSEGFTVVPSFIDSDQIQKFIGARIPPAIATPVV